MESCELIKNLERRLSGRENLIKEYSSAYDKLLLDLSQQQKENRELNDLATTTALKLWLKNDALESEVRELRQMIDSLILKNCSSQGSC